MNIRLLFREFLIAFRVKLFENFYHSLGSQCGTNFFTTGDANSPQAFVINSNATQRLLASRTKRIPFPIKKHAASHFMRFILNANAFLFFIFLPATAAELPNPAEVFPCGTRQKETCGKSDNGTSQTTGQDHAAKIGITDPVTDFHNGFSIHCYPLFLFLVGGFLVGLFVGNLVAGIFFGCLQYIILLQESRKRRKKYEVKGGSDVL